MPMQSLLRTMTNPFRRLKNSARYFYLKKRGKPYMVWPALATDLRDAFSGFKEVRVTFGYTSKNHFLILAEADRVVGKQREYKCIAFHPTTGDLLAEIAAKTLKQKSNTIVVSLPKTGFFVPRKMQKKGITSAIIAHSLAFAKKNNLQAIILRVENQELKKYLIGSFKAIERKQGVEWLLDTTPEETLKAKMLSKQQTDVLTASHK